MSDQGDARRFTEREVALVLKRAVDLDQEEQPPGFASGLTLRELREIAGEVGIPASSIDRAVAEMDRRRGMEPRAFLGPPANRVLIRSVPGRLDPDRLRQLVQIADDRVGSPGVVSEALGAVRWTSRDRLMATQVAISPGDDETTIRVQERFEGRFRRVVHLVPGVWGGILGVSLAGTVGLPALASVAAGAALGFGAGRAVWSVISARSRSRVESLAAELEQRAIGPG